MKKKHIHMKMGRKIVFAVIISQLVCYTLFTLSSSYLAIAQKTHLQNLL